MVVRISDKTQNYSKVTKLLVKPFKNVQYTYLTKFTNVYLYILTKMRNVSLKHFGDSVVTFKKPISSIKSSLFFHYISFIYHHKKKRLTKVSHLLKLRFRILTLNKITNIRTQFMNIIFTKINHMSTLVSFPEYTIFW